MFGDPHFVTFDGQGYDFADSFLNSFWAVKSENLIIQGAAKGKGSWMQGIAVSGNVLGSHTLIAYRTSTGFQVLWDGDPVLTQSRQTVEPTAGVKLYRFPGSAYIPPEAELRKIFSKAEQGKNWFSAGTVINHWKSTTKDVFTFKLPGRIEIMVTASMLDTQGNAVAEVMVKMPPQSGQGGWCGNFNGNARDDTKLGKDQGPASLLQSPSDSEDLFKKFGISFAQNKVPSPRSWSEVLNYTAITPRPAESCEGQTLKLAEIACDHLKESILHDACIKDICITHDVEHSMEASDDTAMMMAYQIGIMNGGNCVKKTPNN